MNGKHSHQTQRKSWQSLTTVILAVALLLGSVTPVLSDSKSGDPSPTPPATPPPEDRLRELASQYRGIEFNSNYDGEMPATEQKAVDQLEVLAEIRDELESMPIDVPPAPYDPTESQVTNGYLIQGTKVSSI